MMGSEYFNNKIYLVYMAVKLKIKFWGVRGIGGMYFIISGRRSGFEFLYLFFCTICNSFVIKIFFFSFKKKIKFLIIFFLDRFYFW